MAARTNRTDITEAWRERIKAAVILDRLVKHVSGKVKMSTTQIRAADILLKKVMPDLSASDVNATLNGKIKVYGGVKFIRPCN